MTQLCPCSLQRCWAFCGTENRIWWILTAGVAHRKLPVMHTKPHAPKCSQTTTLKVVLDVMYDHRSLCDQLWWQMGVWTRDTHVNRSSCVRNRTIKGPMSKMCLQYSKSGQEWLTRGRPRVESLCVEQLSSSKGPLIQPALLRSDQSIPSTTQHAWTCNLLGDQWWSERGR